MHTDADFLAAVAAHPHDQLTRLVYADWLDEQGDPLGEFIRVQVELHHLQDRLGDEHTQRLLAREDELRAECWSAWTDLWDMRTARGLPDSLRLTDSDFPDAFSAVLDAWPTIHRVSVGTNRTIRGLADCPCLHQLRELHIDGWPNPELIDTFLRLPYWNRGATLRLNANLQGRPSLPYIPDHFARLGRLELVQPIPGPPVGRNPRLIDETVEELVADLNRDAGRDFAVLIRPYERLYPLLGDLGGGFFAGHLKSGAPALFGIAPQGRRVAFCTFNGTGRVDKSLWEDTTNPPWTLERIRARFGFELGFIRVRQFEANNRLAVLFWGSVTRSAFADGTSELWPEIADHLAAPKTFTVAFDQREIAVSYRTGKGTGAAG